MEALEQDFNDLLKDCTKEGLTKSQLNDIFQTQPVKKLNWRKFKSFAIIASLLILSILLVLKCESINWALSAIGRLALIRILPYWDWTPLYNTKCLIQKETLETKEAKSRLPALGRFETVAENCVLCETVDYIPVIMNATFSQLESSYLERGLPVIVADSHSPKELPVLLDVIQKYAKDFLESQPCDLATNIMLKKLFNVEIALQKLRHGQILEKWFLQLRNCEFKAVKASRAFTTRPYYYPLQMEPFYTSWLLMSNNFKLEPQRLFLQGLILVQQLSEHFEIQLQPKEPCNESCPIVNIQLNAGECLIFSTDLWVFHYGTQNPKENKTAIATVLEIDWLH